MDAKELLAKIQEVVNRDWSGEVRFNWVRYFLRCLVFQQNPIIALEYARRVEEESLKPKGILMISRVLQRTLVDMEKISYIKRILEERGYGLEPTEKNWKRTQATDIAYRQMTQMIGDFEHIAAQPHISAPKI